MKECFQDRIGQIKETINNRQKEPNKNDEQIIYKQNLNI